MLFKILSNKFKKMEKPYFTRKPVSLFNNLVKPIIVLPCHKGRSFEVIAEGRMG